MGTCWLSVISMGFTMVSGGGGSLMVKLVVVYYVCDSSAKEGLREAKREREMRENGKRRRDERESGPNFTCN